MYNGRIVDSSIQHPVPISRNDVHYYVARYVVVVSIVVYMVIWSTTVRQKPLHVPLSTGHIRSHLIETVSFEYKITYVRTGVFVCSDVFLQTSVIADWLS